MHARILLVEDSPTQRLVAEMVLESAGFVVTAVEDAESVDLAALDGFDLALVDHVLPGASGLELCRTIVAAGGPPVVAMTGHATADTLSEWIAAGAVSWLPKPLDPARSADHVARVLETERRRTPDDAPGPTREQLVDLVATCARELADRTDGGTE